MNQETTPEFTTATEAFENLKSTYSPELQLVLTYISKVILEGPKTSDHFLDIHIPEFAEYAKVDNKTAIKILTATLTQASDEQFNYEVTYTDTGNKVKKQGYRAWLIPTFITGEAIFSVEYNQHLFPIVNDQYFSAL